MYWWYWWIKDWFNNYCTGLKYLLTFFSNKLWLLIFSIRASVLVYCLDNNDSLVVFPFLLYHIAMAHGHPIVEICHVFTHWLAYTGVYMPPTGLALHSFIYIYIYIYIIYYVSQSVIWWKPSLDNTILHPSGHDSHCCSNSIGLDASKHRASQAQPAQISAQKSLHALNRNRRPAYIDRCQYGRDWAQTWWHLGDK